MLEIHDRDGALVRTSGMTRDEQDATKWPLAESIALGDPHAETAVILDALAGTLVFVRDPGLLRSARATEDGTAILAVGGRPGVTYSSRWESDIASG